MPYKDKADRRAFDQRRRELLEAFIREYLQSHPCVDCGNSDIRVLEFDHVRGEKKFCVGMQGLMTIECLLEEIAKCDVRCANCHKIRHHAERLSRIRESAGCADCDSR